MEAFYFALLLIGSFWLGACPFSVWIGRLFLGKKITDYGDNNPGAYNVFRAGGRKAGVLAVFFDIAKGIPFVLLAYLVFDLPATAVLAIALSAILGHAFSPILRWHGGKAIAVTFGALIALPQHDIILAFIIFFILGALFIDVDAWTVMCGITATFTYVLITKGASPEALFMLCVVAVLFIKHFGSLQTLPRHRGRLLNWLQSRRREV